MSSEIQPYLRDEKAKIQCFINFLPQAYQNILEFANTKTPDKTIRKEKLYYGHFKWSEEKSKNWQAKKKEKIEQWEKGFKASPFGKITISFKLNNLPKGSSKKSTPSPSGWIRLSFMNNKPSESVRETLMYQGCDGPHLFQNFHFNNNRGNQTLSNLQGAPTINGRPRSIPRINGSLDNCHVDHQSSMVEVEGKILQTYIYILICPRSSLSSISLTIVEKCKFYLSVHMMSLQAWTGWRPIIF